MCSSCSWQEALETADEIIEMIDDISEDSDRGQEFASSIDEKTRNIRAWIQEHEHTTDKQVNALENMHRGAENWLQD